MDGKVIAGVMRKLAEEEHKSISSIGADCLRRQKEKVETFATYLEQGVMSSEEAVAFCMTMVLSYWAQQEAIQEALT